MIPRLLPTVVASPFSEVGDAGDRFVVAAEGHTFVVGPSLHRIIRLLGDEPSSLEELAARYNAGNPRPLSTASLQAILDDRIPGALIEGVETPPPRQPFVVSRAVFRAETVGAVVRWLTWAFSPAAVAVVAAAFVAALALTIPATLAAPQPLDLTGVVSLVGLILAGLVVHEFGHAAACARYGCAPGEIGAGVYFYFPVLYSDVTEAWRLRPIQRAAVDVGGLYFQAAFVAVVVAAAPGHAVTQAFVMVTAVSMLHMLNPAFKMDGYWLLSDLSGLTNLHGQVGRALKYGLQSLFSSGANDPEDRPQGVKAGALYLYSAYLVVYVAVALQFVGASLSAVAETYPARAAAHLRALTEAIGSGDPAGFGSELVSFAVSSFWPALLAAAVGYVVVRVVRLFV